MTFDLQTYMRRIGLEACPPTVEGLRVLQSAQLHAIVFENIDPLLGIVPSLDPEAVFDKIVLSGRGGYCFELNGLFGRALAALGFEARPVMARVVQRTPGGARTHLAWLVSLEGDEWLADVGFGGPGSITPLKLVPDIRQTDGRTAYRLSDVDGEYLLEHELDGAWAPLYRFDRSRVTAMDIEAANFLCARWEMAPFPDNLMMAFNGPDGRVGLFNRNMRLETPQGIHDTMLDSRADLAAVLSERFHLALPDETVDRVWRRIVRAI